MSPTARSLAYLRKIGFLPEVVERWIPIPGSKGHGVRRDFLGLADILAIRPGSQVVVAIQATTRTNMGARQRKATEEPRLLDWVRSGHLFQVWGWDKVGKDCRLTVTGWEMIGGWQADTRKQGRGHDEVREALERCTPLWSGDRVRHGDDGR